MQELSCRKDFCTLFCAHDFWLGWKGCPKASWTVRIHQSNLLGVSQHIHMKTPLQGCLWQAHISVWAVVDCPALELEFPHLCIMWWISIVVCGLGICKGIVQQHWKQSSICQYHCSVGCFNSTIFWPEEFRSLTGRATQKHRTSSRLCLA